MEIFFFFFLIKDGFIGNSIFKGECMRWEVKMVQNSHPVEVTTLTVRLGHIKLPVFYFLTCKKQEFHTYCLNLVVGQYILCLFSVFMYIHFLNIHGILGILFAACLFYFVCSGHLCLPSF